MSIDPKTLPEATVIEDECGVIGRWQSKYLPQVTIPILRVFVPVPDGMTVEDATQALADHVQWVPLPDGPTGAHVGKRLRCAWNDGASVVQDVVHKFDALAGVEWDGGAGDRWHRTSGDWFIHPNDVPTDPDAELIDGMANRLVQIDSRGRLSHADVINISRELLAVVREHEAGAR